MFNLRKLKNVITEGVLGVSGVPNSTNTTDIELSSLKNRNTDKTDSVLSGVSCERSGTPEGTVGTPVDISPAGQENLISEGCREYEHREHQKHRQISKQCDVRPVNTKLGQALKVLSQDLGVTEAGLVTSYFTDGDLHDIANGGYDGLLPELAELIRTDPFYKEGTH